MRTKEVPEVVKKTTNPGKRMEKTTRCREYLTMNDPTGAISGLLLNKQKKKDK